MPVISHPCRYCNETGEGMCADCADEKLARTERLEVLLRRWLVSGYPDTTLMPYEEGKLLWLETSQALDKEDI